MTEVVESTTSRDAMVALEAIFSHSSTSRINQLSEELLSLRRGSLSAKEYGVHFKELCDQLSAVGKPDEESDKSHWFLRGLGATFANFADARMSMKPIPSFSTLLHQAVQFDIMSKSMDPSESSSSVAFTASSGQNPSSGASSFRPSNSHSSGNGGRGGGNGGRGGGPPRKPRCQICRGEHYADKCPLYLSRAPPSSANLAEAFTSTCNVSGSSSDWYVDSGASAHMTSDPPSLDNVQPYTSNGNVIVGNGNSL